MSAQDQIKQFAQSLVPVACVKSNVPELIGFYGDSGGGKTVTALICLVGMSGPAAKIGVVDTENRRAGMAADIVQAMCREHYKAVPEIVCVNLEAPFHPLKYVAAIQVLAAAKCQAFLVDSMSHAWNGNGGYLDLKEEVLDRMAGTDWKRREKCALAAAAQVKPQTHAKLVDAILHLNAPTVLCFRSKEKTTIGKNQQGQTVIETDPYGTPIQEPGMIYEMLVSGEVSARDGIGGYCSFRGIGRKTTHPAILKLLPAEGEQFGFGHGEALAAWARQPEAQAKPAKPPEAAVSAPAQAPGGVSEAVQGPKAAPAAASAQAGLSPEEQQKKKLMTELWRLTKPFRPEGEQNWTATREWLLAKGAVPPDTSAIRNLTVEQLENAIMVTRSQLVNPR